jgi:2,4-dienoyl-CoA reductase-like NADH-dependent reductase (Old Yellow Enzyme family)
MTASTDVLFRPFSVKSLTLKNRIVMAPMTRSFSPGGVPGEASAAYYRRRAEGGVGLILSEGTVVDRPASYNQPGIPFFHGEAALAGWQHVADEVHAAGGRMGPQIWHTGSTVGSDANWEPAEPVESPSGLMALGQPRGVAMSEEAIADTIAAFARAAADAKRLGFDVVEVHGAHGYLIDEFFWADTNQRADRYGGATLGERARFGAEIVAAVRAAVGPDFPILMRVGQWKGQDFAARMALTPDELSDWLAPLVGAGVDVIHCSQRRFWEPEFPEIDGEHGLNLAGWAKKLTGTATISVGSVGLSNDFVSSFTGESAGAAGIDQLIERMEREEFDLIAVGRALIANPHWVNIIARGEQDKLLSFSPAALGELV